MINSILNDSFWLPKNYTWAQVNKYNQYNLKYAIIYPIYVAVLLYILRCIFERLIALPIGRFFQLKEHNLSLFNKYNHLLDCYYKDKAQSLSESIYLVIYYYYFYYSYILCNI